MAISIVLNQIVTYSTYPATTSKYGTPNPLKFIGYEYDVSGGNLSSVYTKRANDDTGDGWPATFENVQTDFAGFWAASRGLLVSGVRNVSAPVAIFNFVDAASVEVDLPTVQALTDITRISYTFDISGNIIINDTTDGTWSWDIYIDQYFQIIDPDTGIILSVVETRTGDFTASPVAFTGIPLKDVTLKITDDYGATNYITLVYQGVPGVKIDGDLVIWESNFLKFIDVANKNDKVYDLTFDSEYNFKNRFYIEYCQKIQQSDSDFWIQLQSDFTGHIVQLIKSDGTIIDISGDLDNQGVVGNRNLYELDFDFSSLNGSYYVLITTDDALRYEKVFQSEIFNVADEHTDTSIISWAQTNTNYAFQSGIIWDARPQKIRVDGEITHFITGSETEGFNDTNDQAILLSSHPRQIGVFVLYKAAYYIVKILNIALQHKEFFIEDVKYRKTGSFEADNSKGSNLYKGSNEFRQVEYLIPR